MSAGLGARSLSFALAVADRLELVAHRTIGASQEIMVLHPMYVHADDPERTLGFEVNLHSPAIFGHLKFIQFIEQKFDGRRGSVARKVVDEHHSFGTTSIRFPDDTFASAKAFCEAKLMDNGSPISDLHHELEHAGLSEEVDKDLHWQMTGEPNNPYRRRQM